jgi:Arc/MetJ-type ribon-helix-helix transcriptional regulator
VRIDADLPDEDVRSLDAHASETGLGTRSAVLHAAVQLLRATRAADDYDAAWTDPVEASERAVWDVTVADGLEE